MEQVGKYGDVRRKVFPHSIKQPQRTYKVRMRYKFKSEEDKKKFLAKSYPEILELQGVDENDAKGKALFLMEAYLKKLNLQKPVYLRAGCNRATCRRRVVFPNGTVRVNHTKPTKKSLSEVFGEVLE